MIAMNMTRVMIYHYKDDNDQHRNDEYEEDALYLWSLWDETFENR